MEPLSRCSGTSDKVLPAFSVQLSPNNPWFRMAQLIPWNEIESKFSATIASGNGQPAYSLRMVLGSLIIWDNYDLSDIETVEHIKENPYLQFFIGLNEYRDDPPLDSTVLAEFRKMISVEMLQEINNMLRFCLSSAPIRIIH